MSDERSWEFLDSNVLIYAYDATAGPRRIRAEELTRSLWEARNGCLSVQVLQEFFVNVTRKIPEPLDSVAAAAIVADLSDWRTHVPRTEDVLAAIEIQDAYGISFWDATIVRSALQLGCEIIWSEDLNPGQTYRGVRVLNPFEAHGTSTPAQLLGERSRGPGPRDSATDLPGP